MLRISAFVLLVTFLSVGWAHALTLDNLSVRVIDLETNDLVSDLDRGKLYASSPGTAGPATGNSIVTIDPESGTVEGSVFVGSDPNVLALSNDGSALYVGLDGAAQIRRYDPESRTAGLAFSLGSDPFFGPYFAEDIAVQPGNPDTIAVSLRNAGISPRHGGVAVFDNGFVLPTATARHTGSNRIEFGPDPSALFGTNNETTEFGFREMLINAMGVTVVDVTADLLPAFGVDIEHAQGAIYATNGRAIDPASGTLLGTYAASGILEAVPEWGVIFFLEGRSGTTRTLKMFDLDTFVLLDEATIEGLSGAPSSLVRWGESGLAFRTDSQVFLVTPEPTSAVLLLAGLLGLSRRRIRSSR